MGETRAKSELDSDYREAAARWLAQIWKDKKFRSQEQLAKAMGVDRSTASRYLSKDTRAPIQRLQRLERSLGVEVPQALVDAFWASDQGEALSEAGDIERELKAVVDSIRTKSPDAQRVLLEEVRQALQKAGAK